MKNYGPIPRKKGKFGSKAPVKRPSTGRKRGRPKVRRPKGRLKAK